MRVYLDPTSDTIIVIHATYHTKYKDGTVSSCVNCQELARTLGQDVVSLMVSAGRRNRTSLHAWLHSNPREGYVYWWHYHLPPGYWHWRVCVAHRWKVLRDTVSSTSLIYLDSHIMGFFSFQKTAPALCFQIKHFIFCILHCKCLMYEFFCKTFITPIRSSVWESRQFTDTDIGDSSPTKLKTVHWHFLRQFTDKIWYVFTVMQMKE